MSTAVAMKELIKLQIEDAFANVLYPGDEKILSSPNYWGAEGEKLRGLLIGKHWRDLTTNDVQEGQDSFISCVSPEAFVFYLPAFLIKSLESENGSGLLRSIVAILTLPSGTVKAVTEWLNQLTKYQRRTIRDFFSYIAEDTQSRSQNPDIELQSGFYFWSAFVEDDNENKEVQEQERNKILKLLIKKTFADAAYPGDDNILRNSYFYDIDDASMFLALKGKRWSEITPEIILPFRSYFFDSVTPVAFAFFLPAFLLASLDGRNDIDYFTVRALTPYQPVTHSTEKMFDQLTELQRSVTEITLEFLEHGMYPY